MRSGAIGSSRRYDASPAITLHGRMPLVLLLLIVLWVQPGAAAKKKPETEVTKKAKKFAAQGDMEGLVGAVGRGAELNDTRGRGTPLMHAVLRGWPEGVAYLLSAGAAVELGNSDGLSPFQAAAFSNHPVRTPRTSTTFHADCTVGAPRAIWKRLTQTCRSCVSSRRSKHWWTAGRT